MWGYQFQACQQHLRVLSNTMCIYALADPVGKSLKVKMNLQIVEFSM